eukprot:jgi/Botrbrau1/2374/Bobra.0395s0008.1
MILLRCRHQPLPDLPLSVVGAFRTLVAAGTPRSPVSQPETDEDLGGAEDVGELWKDKEWYKNNDISGAQASRLLCHRLFELGAQKPGQLVEVVKRMKEKEDIGPVLKAVRQWRKRRLAMQQHSLSPPVVSVLLVKRLLQLERPDLAMELVQEANSLGLAFTGVGVLQTLLVALSSQGRLDLVVKLYEAMQVAGVRPTRSFGYALVRAFRDNGRLDLAAAYGKELELNGVPMRPAVKETLAGAE